MKSSSQISAVIIDDESDAITLLKMYLRHFPEVIVTGTESDAKEGLKLVKESIPDLVFLDIDMPEMNGLQVAYKIYSGNYQTEIVFTTAHQYYAYDTLYIEPLDFLTKPFGIDDLEVVIKKYKAKTEKKKLERKFDQLVHQKNSSLKLTLPTIHGILIVDLKDIVYLKSQANNCNLYLQDGKVETVTRNLYVLIEMINSPAFYQISRQTVININYLKSVDKRKNLCTLQHNQFVCTETITDNYLQSFDKLDFVQIIQEPPKRD